MTLRSWRRLLKVRQEMCEDPHVPVVGLNVSSYPTQRPVSCHCTPNSSFSSTYDWYTHRHWVTWWNSIKDVDYMWLWGLNGMRWCVLDMHLPGHHLWWWRWCWCSRLLYHKTHEVRHNYDIMLRHMRWILSWHNDEDTLPVIWMALSFKLCFILSVVGVSFNKVKWFFKDIQDYTLVTFKVTLLLTYKPKSTMLWAMHYAAIFTASIL